MASPLPEAPGVVEEGCHREGVRHPLEERGLPREGGQACLPSDRPAAQGEAEQEPPLPLPEEPEGWLPPPPLRLLLGLSTCLQGSATATRHYSPSCFQAEAHPASPRRHYSSSSQVGVYNAQQPFF